MAQSQVTIECGYCLRKDEELPEPKTLPCSHVHCIQCLSEYFEENNTLVCAVEDCGEVFEGSPDTLPSYDMIEGNDWCDVCVDKKMDIQQAGIYCTVCCNKFCERHLTSHDDVLSKHKKISLEEYRSQAKKMQTRCCTKHVDQPYVMGCKLCQSLACLKCIANPVECDNGGSHSLLPLDDLVAALLKDDISSKMLVKEDQYEMLFKQTSKVRAEYDNKTSEMIQLIRQCRDAQINALKLKYKRLEDEVVEKRRKSRVDMAEFMEDIVLKKWTQLRNCRKKMESRVKCSHQVDVVKGLKDLKEEIQKYVEEEIPKLQLKDEVELKKLGESRAVELQVVSSCDIVLDCEQAVTTPQPLPRAIKLLESVQLPTRPLSVCQYKGSTYVGLWDGTVTRIDNSYQLHNSFISPSGLVESTTVYKDKFYTLSGADPLVVNVYDTSGRHITSWNHPYHNWLSNMLTVVADQVVIADPPNQRISVYSLTGESLRHIPCPLLSDSYTTLCAVDNTSVVISNCDTSKVFRVNLVTGEVVWTLSDVKYPQGLVCHGSYILLAARNNNTIYILDTTTGAVVSQLADRALGGGDVFGLGVYGTTLVVPLFDHNKVIFYELKEK